MGSAVSDSFAEDHPQPRSAPRTPIGTPGRGHESPSVSYGSSPRRNPHTGSIYNGISAGVIPQENSGGGGGGAAPGPQSLQGQHHQGIAPGAVGLAGVAPRGTQGNVLAKPQQSPGLVPEVNAEAEEYYGGKEVWSRSRTYSNVRSLFRSF